MQFLDSSNHLDMPLFDTSELYNCLRHLVEIDKDWFPASTANTPGQLYMRLAHISTDPIMGVKSAWKTRIFAMMSPTKLQTKALAVKCSDGVNKNWPLGHG